MPTLEVSVPTELPAATLWPIVRDLSRRAAYLPSDGARGVIGDADRIEFEMRLPRGWTRVVCSVVREVPGSELEEHAEGQGLRYQALLRVAGGAVSAEVAYEVDGVPRLLRPALRPLLEAQLRGSLQRLVSAAAADPGG